MVAAATGRGRWECLAAGMLAVMALVVITGAVITGHFVRAAPGAAALLVVLVVFHEQLLSWRSLVGLTVLVILFIPIRRYSLPASLPINLEPYRILVAFVIFGWIMTVLVDRRFTIRGSGFEAPIFAYLVVILLSMMANLHRVQAVESATVKSVSFLLSYILVFYVFLSVLRTPRDIDFFVRLLVTGGAVLAFFAIFESVTHMNVFNHLSRVIPVLRYTGGAAPDTLRGGGLRVYASAQHPIALGAAFAVLIPLALYLAERTAAYRWRLAGVAMLLGLFATRSRTGITMLMAIGIVYLALRWRQTVRYWPAFVPLVLTIHFVVPGAIGSIKQSFLPKGGLIAQENRNSVGSGRLATFGPVFRSEFKPNPVLGKGYSTRIVHPELEGLKIAAAPITDDQWLAVLAETGIAGAFTFGWIFVRFARRTGAAAWRDRSARGSLLVATCASVVAYAIGMWTYDSFAFIQVSFLLFFILAIGAATVLTTAEEWHEPASAGELATPGERLAHAHG